MADGGDGRPVILVAVDGTETSLRAGSYAAGLARGRAARIVCLFVHTERLVTSASAAALALIERQDKERAAMELRDALVGRAAALGLEAEFVERTGSAYTEIVRVADEFHVDVVVVGASEKFGHRLLGAIGTRLVRCGRWPVTVVP